MPTDANFMYLLAAGDKITGTGTIGGRRSLGMIPTAPMQVIANTSHFFNNRGIR